MMPAGCSREHGVDIRVDDLTSAAMAALLHEHLASMAEYSPPESVHALDLESLRAPDIIVWSAWDGDELLGCGALKVHDSDLGEIKSMRTARAHLRKGVAAALLRHIVDEARRRGLQRVSLETGSMAEFAAARALYRQFGFESCAPFADYREDRHSEFFTMALDGPAARI
jgi:putative acetyltransferase